MRKSVQIASLLVAAALLGGVVMPACAVDGVVLIDQNKALAGNITPGDAPGFPVTISLPGSYRLASNLVVPLGVDGIQITADNVTIDLNGFSIILAAVSNFNPPFASGITDLGVARRHITVHDGNVVAPTQGSAIGLFSTAWAKIAGTNTVTFNATLNFFGAGILVGEWSLIQNNVSDGLIEVICPGILSHNVTSGTITKDITLGACAELADVRGF